MSVLPIKSIKDLDADDIYALPVHPAAEVFPMLPEDELDDPAEDIKANGLQQPLVVHAIDGVLTLIDGRNRREACKLAEVAPTAMPLNGKDPVAYIIANNINRRHMTKGQQAMTIAMIYPEPEQAHRGKQSEAAKLSGSAHLSRERIKEARVVLKHTPDNAALVHAGTMTLSAAHEKASNVKIAAEGEEGVMRKLRAQAPDLADLVVEGTLSLHEAAVALEARKEREHRPLLHMEGTQLIYESRLCV